MFKRKYGESYQKLLRNKGISISPVKIGYDYSCESDGLNRNDANSSVAVTSNRVSKWFKGNRGLLHFYFIIGTITSILLTIIAYWLLLQNIRNNLSKHESSSLLIPLLSDNNNRKSRVAFSISKIHVIVSLIVATAFHEFGHILAAKHSGIKVENVGIFLFLIFPGAYVKLNEQALNNAKPLTRLIVTSAGVWHNALFAGIAWTLYKITPYVLALLYVTGDGVLVTHVHPESTLFGANSGGLKLYLPIRNINGCPTRDLKSYYQCLDTIKHETTQVGYCLRLNRTSANNNYANEQDCCHQFLRNSFLTNVNQTATKLSKNFDFSSNKLCYFYTTTYLAMLHYTSTIRKTTARSLNNKLNFICLSARWVAQTYPLCKSSADCYGYQYLNVVCAKPTYYIDDLNNGGVGENITRKILYHIVQGQGNFVLYESETDIELKAAYITLSDYVPKSKCLPTLLPGFILRCFAYLFAVNLTLALLNAIPFVCFLDGRHILENGLDYGACLFARLRNNVFNSRNTKTNSAATYFPLNPQRRDHHQTIILQANNNIDGGWFSLKLLLKQLLTLFGTILLTLSLVITLKYHNHHNNTINRRKP